MTRTVCSAIAFLLLMILLIPALVRSQGAEPAVVVIEGGTLIDGNGGQPVRDAVIVIRGNRIEAVSQKGRANVPAGAKVLRADGKFIVPGLMDAHIHWAGFLGELFLNWGVTSVFEIGGGGESGIIQRDAINRGKLIGPRIFLSGGSLAGARIAALGGVTGAEGVKLQSRMVVSSAAQARDVVKTWIEAGVDMIKVHRGPPMEVYQAAAEEAHKAGLPVVAQPLGPTVYAREAALAGADVLEHAAGISYAVSRDPSKWKGWGEIEEHSLDPSPFSDVDDGKASEMIRLLLDRKVALEPDLICYSRGLQRIRDRYELQDYQLLRSPALAYVPERSRAKWLRNFAEFEDVDPEVVALREKGSRNLMRFIGQFAKAGGKVLAGTDASGNGWATPGIGLHHELDLLAEAGLTPMQVLMAATRNTAEAFRILNRLGTVEAGKLADLIVVNDDPLKDVHNLQKIEWVIQDGRVVDRGYHSWFTNPFVEASVDGGTWVAGLKKEMESMRTTAFGQPPPGIETISPTVVTEGDPTLTVTLKGYGFTKESRAFFEGKAVQARWMSPTEMRVTIDAALIQRAGAYTLTVTNPEPLQRPQWGATSNKAHLLVNFRYR